LTPHFASFFLFKIIPVVAYFQYRHHRLQSFSIQIATSWPNFLKTQFVTVFLLCIAWSSKWLFLFSMRPSYRITGIILSPYLSSFSESCPMELCMCVTY
jgi:hypothetical protein